MMMMMMTMMTTMVMLTLMGQTREIKMNTKVAFCF